MIEVLTPVFSNGTEFAPGEVIEMSTEDEQAVVNVGAGRFVYPDAETDKAIKEAKKDKKPAKKVSKPAKVEEKAEEPEEPEAPADEAEVADDAEAVDDNEKA